MGYAANTTPMLPTLTEAEIDELNTHFHDQPPEALLEWATAYFGQQVVLTCSFGGMTGMVLLDMVARLQRDIPIVFIDTDLLFPETYALAEQAARRYGITLTRCRPALSLEQQDEQEGPHLYARDPDRCCHIRKVTPMKRVLQPYQAWISGVRRDQSSSRATTRLLQWNTRYHLVKLCPLAFWSEQDVRDYIGAHDVPYNPLLDHGYTSLGCVPCTQPASTDDPRGGRWSGFDKTECGIHL